MDMKTNRKIGPQQVKRFASVDGTSLSYAFWPVEPELNDGAVPAVVLLHREGEHSARLAHLVTELDMPEACFFALDMRGHGLSEGRRGDVEKCSDLVRDLNEFIAHLKDSHGVCEREIIVIGQSVGALIAAAWVHDYAPNIRALVLASPAFGLSRRSGLAGLKASGKSSAEANVVAKLPVESLIRNPERAAIFRSDPLIVRAFSRRFLADIEYTAKRIVDDAFAIHVPTLLLRSGKDVLTLPEPQERFFNNLGSVCKEYQVQWGFFHDSLGDSGRAPVLGKISDFIRRVQAMPDTLPSLLDADRQGKTREEFLRLSSPETHPLKAVKWAVTRAFMRHVGKMSNGVRIGLENGFDSGVSLDYVYENEPRGSNFIGRMLDGIYLNNRSWQSVRQRRRHVQELLELASQRLQGEGREIRILDVAAGTGQYILDFIKHNRADIDHVLMRDFITSNVDKGKAILASEQLTDIAAFEWGDAFSAESLATLPRDRTVTLASGFYELFSDNSMVIESLKGVAAATEDNGYLIFTTKQWNPNLEFMARVMQSHKNGDPWLLRRRCQREIDQLMQTAGFHKVAQRIDRWGIFSVTLVQKAPR